MPYFFSLISFFVLSDRSANLAVNELQSQYDQQIKEYQSNINHALEETNKARVELKEFQENNLLKEKQTNDLTHSLKQDNEKLQTELKHRGTSFLFLSSIVFHFPLQSSKRTPL